MSDAIPGAMPAAPSAAPVPTTPDVNAAPMDAAGAPSATPDAKADPAKAPTKKEAKAEANLRKKFNIKVDNKEEEVELDLSNEDEIRKHLQLSKAAYKRMQESAEMRKGVQELLDTLRTDPLKVLTDPRLQIPEDIRKKLAESIINDELQEMAKTPEQKEKERLQKEYERLKKEVEDERKGREAAENQRLEAQAAVQLDTEISSAIEMSGMPKNARTVRYFAEALKFCVENDLNLSAKDLVPYVKKQALSEFREVISALPDEDFENWLGKDQISRIRKRSLQRAKTVETPSNIKPTGAEAKKPEEPQKKIPYKEFMKSLGRM